MIKFEYRSDLEETGDNCVAVTKPITNKTFYYPWNYNELLDWVEMSQTKSYKNYIGVWKFKSFERKYK